MRSPSASAADRTSVFGCTGFQVEPPAPSEVGRPDAAGRRVEIAEGTSVVEKKRGMARRHAGARAAGRDVVDTQLAAVARERAIPAVQHDRIGDTGARWID